MEKVTRGTEGQRLGGGKGRDRGTKVQRDLRKERWGQRARERQAKREREGGREENREERREGGCGGREGRRRA